jgi:hypothetical protein
MANQYHICQEDQHAIPPACSIVGDLLALRQRVSTQDGERNVAHCPIHWQFTSQQVRTKLADLYPVKESLDLDAASPCKLVPDLFRERDKRVRFGR